MPSTSDTITSVPSFSRFFGGLAAQGAKSLPGSEHSDCPFANWSGVPISAVEMRDCRRDCTASRSSRAAVSPLPIYLRDSAGGHDQCENNVEVGASRVTYTLPRYAQIAKELMQEATSVRAASKRVLRQNLCCVRKGAASERVLRQKGCCVKKGAASKNVLRQKGTRLSREVLSLLLSTRVAYFGSDDRCLANRIL
jgi:hypothetical protein